MNIRRFFRLKKIHEATGDFCGQHMSIPLDHELAALFVQDDETVLGKLAEFDKQLLNTATLAKISSQYSRDVASLYFMNRIFRDQHNGKYQSHYQTFNRYQAEGQSLDLSRLKKYYVLFIPGLAYKEDTTTGANFAQQIKLLNSIGVDNELIETEEWGLVEDNAQLIVNRLKQLSSAHDKIVLVSASKGGLETSLALGKYLDADIASSIQAWVSVGGILRGSPIADQSLKFPKSFLTRILLWKRGLKFDLVHDMSYVRRTKTYTDLKFPSHLKIIHFVGIPLSTQISKDIKSRYCSMRHLGPNDGLTPIADEITDQGIVISELGLDHYYRDPEIDKKTLSLALCATME